MSDKRPFFVGYLPTPRELRLLLISVAVAAITAFVVAAWAVGTTQDNPGDGRLRFDLGRQTIVGVLETSPYPMVHVTHGTDVIATGETLMLAGAGKFGVEPHASRVDSPVVEVTGVLLNRGDIRMLQVPNPRRNLKAIDGEGPSVNSKNLGRWRLAGEICDGKCLAGAMRPGRGIAHKACAELCIEGGVPPVFVTTQPVADHEFMLIANGDGEPLNSELLEKVGVYISLEGELIQRGSLAVFLANHESIEVLP
ncbi:MAG: hypothetical protein OXE94_12300 [Aestuariivita sp.]|nr:hypothetical protein [Aestuariivita sp.]MCY4201323.1 hypothetical protein [Aestuariivita sp.]MCY4289454.1 hypothetical protein [Aestuariivita sp.]MCY4347339.1 hypothetical protein [Aestuariivita sp.]